MFARLLRSTLVPIHVLVAILLVLTSVVFSSTPVRAATIITVTEMTDEFNEDGDCSLREAIESANSDSPTDACSAGNGADLILLPEGTFVFTIPPFDGKGGALNPSGMVTIRGAGMYKTIIDANRLDRVVAVGDAPDVVTIERLTLRNGYINDYDEHGGGIFNRAGRLTLRSVRLTGNESANRGGAIYNDEDAAGLTILHSRIDHNTGAGGAVDNQVEGDTAQMTISDSVIQHNDNDGVFTDGDAVIRRTTVADNGSSGIAAFGSPRVQVTGSTITGNASVFDGGGMRIGYAAVVSVINSTISGNSARSSGGGIYYQGSTTAPSTVTLWNTTVTDNTANSGRFQSVGGGGVAGPLRLRNSLVAGNTDLGGATPDCAGSVISQGFNLVGDTTGCTIDGVTTGNRLNVDPLLGPLADNGGATMTHALLSGSPAIDRGRPKTPGTGPATCTVIDQRGTPRPQDGDGKGANRCDIGAYERQAIGS